MFQVLFFSKKTSYTSNKKNLSIIYLNQFSLFNVNASKNDHISIVISTQIRTNRILEVKVSFFPYVRNSFFAFLFGCFNETVDDY